MYKRLNESYVRYNPDHWNQDPDCRQSHNCYSYFLDDKHSKVCTIYKYESDEERKMMINAQPGHYCGKADFVNYEDTTCEKLKDRVLCDNPNIKVIDKNTNCGENYYKGALFIDEKKQYHFYRLDDDGVWSHKDGGNGVTKLDYSGNVINDVMTSDRRYYNYEADSIRSYDKFCTYFCVPENSYMETESGRNRMGKMLWKS
jgi:hypothetical protein